MAKETDKTTQLEKDVSIETVPAYLCLAPLASKIVKRIEKGLSSVNPQELSTNYDPYKFLGIILLQILFLLTDIKFWLVDKLRRHNV